uniref:AIG1-type G domain-containing protein n=1 Tax=Amphimedon queenslandica TaxID=400682 RepID=A0A1X7TVS2_AMPQE
MSVLLIGSTGMGKSTLGNFLLDPDEKHVFDYQTFAVAKDNSPMTKEVKVGEKSVQIDDSNEFFLQLIDTPGLNDSDAKDLSHMINIIKKLNECEEIRACILVVKFNAKIDAQYKATIEYYSKLLPGLFDKNVIIVLTDYAIDERSEKMRKKQSIDVEKVKSNTIEELHQCADKELTYSPQLFTIDCQPLGSDEIETNQNIRLAILAYIKNLQPIKLKDLSIAKTDFIKQKDAERYKKLTGEIDGYNKRLKEVHTNSKEALEETRKKEMEIITKESEKKDLKEMLRQKDTTEDVVATHWSIAEEWRVFRWFTREFNVKSQYKISKYDTWTNGKCKFKNIDQKSDVVSGKVEGKFMRGIYASVTVYTQKRIKYEESIQDLKERLENEDNIIQLSKTAKELFLDKHKKELEEIKLLQKHIAERKAAAENCLLDHMTLKEAIQMLERLEESRSPPEESY